MAESPNLINSLNSKRLNELRVPLLQSSSSGVHRSQSVPNQGNPPPKLASRSHTMPMLGEDTVRDSSPLKLDSLSKRTAAPYYTVDLTVDSQPEAEKPLNPVRRAPSGRLIESKLTGATDDSGHSRLVIVWLFCCFAFLIVAPLISVILGVKLHTPNFHYTSSQDSTDLPGRRLELFLNLVSADPLQSVASFDWIIQGDTCLANTSTIGECPDVNLFMDSNLFAGNSNTLQQSTDIPTTPLFRFNVTALLTDAFRFSSPFFRTDLLVISRDLTSRSSLVNYPFDSYTASISMFAEDSEGQTVNLVITESSGNAVGFTTSASDCTVGPGEDPWPLSMICIKLLIKRGALVRAFCIIVIIAVWLITMILLLLTFTSIIFGFRQRAEVLIVPVATIFAFTQLRSSMPGAPEGFGDILDFTGLLPCLAILAFSAALSLGAFILTDPTQRTEVLTWGRLRRELHLIRKKPNTENEAEEGESEISNDGA